MKGKLFIGLGLMALGVMSCSDEVEFDQEAYDKMVKESFVVQNVDPGHNWATVGTANATINVNGEYETVYEVGIYLDNPVGASEATLLYEEQITGSGTINASVSLPLSKNIVYVGVYDEDGRGMAQAVTVENGNITATIDLSGSTTAAAQRRAAASTDRSDYIKTNPEKYYLEYLEGYSNNFADYYDMSAIPTSDQLNKQEYLAQNNYQASPAYGDGKHFVLPAGKSYTISSKTFENAWDNTVIIVRGTLTIPSEMSWFQLWGNDHDYGQTIVVASGGKLICNAATMKLANKSNIINFGEVELNGTYMDYANGAPRGFFNGGTITGTNGAGINFAGGTPYYNSGDIDFTDNGYIKFNGNITFTNVGHIHAYNCAAKNSGAEAVNEWGISAGAQNSTVYNLCEMIFDRFFGVNVYVGTDNSLLYAKEGLFTNNGGQITLGAQAMIKCGIWYDNGCTVAGKLLSSNYSIIKVTNYMQEVNGGSVGITLGYVYFDINAIAGQEWHNDQVKEKMVRLKVSENSALNSITIPADEEGCNSIGFNSKGNNGGGKPKVTSFSMRYCFEDNFPDVGDYDFNDVVLTMTPTLKNKKLTLKVSLDAVGATKTIGAAIRIVGLKSSDLKSYSVIEGFTSLPSNLEANYHNINTTETFLIENQEPNNTSSMVVVLFKDAHWAINPQLGSDGSIQNKFYNTVARDVASNKEYVTPKEATYEFVFNDDAKAQNMLKENLYDVFIVEPYNGGYWEVHTVQNGFKTAQVVTPVKPANAAGKTYEEAYGTNMPWAIMVPGSFKYPIEWQVIGKKTGAALSGAYKQAGHSFGEWAENSSTATDWYDYPTADLVFE